MVWILFETLKRPYYNRAGRIIESINGMRNRFNRDDFSGGGRIYPDLSRFKKIEEHESRDKYLVSLDILPQRAADFIAANPPTSVTLTIKSKFVNRVKRQFDPNIVTFRLARFNPKIIPDIDAQRLIGIWEPKPESGVTN